jgi:hypothetical protein
MKTIIIILIISFIFTQTNCPHRDIREQSLVDELLKGISEQSNEEKRIEYLKANIDKSSKALITSQIKSLISAFSFILGRTSCIKIIDKYILGLTCKEVGEILKTFSFTAEKFEALDVIKETIYDIQNRETVVNEFSFSSDKEKARQMLSDVRNRNCIFGTIKEKVAIFIIDQSGSMEAAFTFNGKRYTRLSLVKEELSKTIKEQLRPYQTF